MSVKLVSVDSSTTGDTPAAMPDALMSFGTPYHWNTIPVFLAPSPPLVNIADARDAMSSGPPGANASTNLPSPWSGSASSAKNPRPPRASSIDDRNRSAHGLLRARSATYASSGPNRNPLPYSLTPRSSLNTPTAAAMAAILAGSTRPGVDGSDAIASLTRWAMSGFRSSSSATHSSAALVNARSISWRMPTNAEGSSNALPGFVAASKMELANAERSIISASPPE